MAQMTLYTSGCPNCRLLKQKLDDKKLKYNIVDDVDKMVELGFTRVPVLEVDGKYLDFNEALMYLQNIN